jgi:hypothetical protein
MKTFIAALTLLLLFTFFPKDIVNAQDAGFASLLHVNVSACFSDGGCEVVTRQYTGLVNFYSINVRCMDASGNFGDWQNWTYSGISTGSACN